MISGGNLSGHFNIRKYNAETGQLVEERDFDNLITNFGLQEFCKGRFFIFPTCCVGTGTTEPLPTDTTLENFLAEASTGFWGAQFSTESFNTPQPPDYISTLTATARFNAGTFDGDNITEVGVSKKSNNVHMVWSRALILDSQGRPSAITVLSNEYLDVRYTLSFHPVLTDQFFTFVMDGITYSCVSRYAHAATNVWRHEGYGEPLARGKIGLIYAYSSDTLGEITGEPVYTASSQRSDNLTDINSTDVPWVSATPYSYFTTQTLPLGRGNLAEGIGALLVGPTSKYVGGISSRTQITISPRIMKDADTTITFTFGQTIGRWEPPTP